MSILQKIGAIATLIAAIYFCPFARADGDALPDRITRIQAVSWSPDGVQFVISTNRGFEAEEANSDNRISYLWLVDVNGKNLKQITFAGRDEQGKPIHYLDKNPRWSPNGKQIAFDSDRGETHYDDPEDRLRQIFLCNNDGTNPHQISAGQGWINNEQPSWNPSGKQLAWLTDRNASADIMLADWQGKEIGYLSADPKIKEYYPSWSKDGTTIAFMASPQDNTPLIHIYTRKLESYKTQKENGKFINPLSLQPTELVAFKSWYGMVGICSPTDDKMAFVQGQNPTDIWLINLDGTGLRRVTDLPKQDLGANYFSPPTWSPKGDKIAFTYVSKRTNSPDAVEDGIYICNIADGLITEVSIQPHTTPPFK